MKRLYFIIFILLSIQTPFCLAQVDTVITIETTLGDTTETFWLQIPGGYQPGVPAPLLIGWHQWGGNCLEFKTQTDFDSIADARGWIAASHYGVGSTHWNNHPTQSHVVDVINWISQHYTVDPDRIYMVGSSMGGAAPMIFSNNHLDPQGPIIAAAASMSGIQDCERRYYEQGVNHSMIGAFGGTPDQVPYEYHRNSAVVFDDSTQSMHYNAMHLPLFLTFGRAWTDSVWRCHAEDLYNLMIQFADTVVLHESSLPGHGWAACEEELICDFLENFTAVRTPLTLNINADENGRWYWATIEMRDSVESFARFTASMDTVGILRLEFNMISNVASASLDLPSLGFTYASDFYCRWTIADGQTSLLVFEGVPNPPQDVLKDGIVFCDWTYDPGAETLTLQAQTDGSYTVIMQENVSPPGMVIKRKSPPFTFSEVPGGVFRIQSGQTGYVNWDIYDILGRKVLSQGGTLEAGQVMLLHFPGDLAAGIYVLHLNFEGASGFETARKLVILP